ncbi:isocitrate dehydrogenase kinase/phosphatase AceK regulatory subunit [Escherichia coli]
MGTDNLAESHLQVANELFYRNKAAWLVGKLITPSGTLPLFTANPPDGRRRVIY